MTKTKPLTHNQQVVFDVLSQADRPQTAYEILETDAARKQGLKAPLTIYRALDSLVARALVHRIESLNAFIACDHGPHPEPAAFLICSECKQATEISLEACKQTFRETAQQHGFQIGQVNVEMTGLCPACASSKAD